MSNAQRYGTHSGLPNTYIHDGIETSQGKGLGLHSAVVKLYTAFLNASASAFVSSFMYDVQPRSSWIEAVHCPGAPYVQALALARASSSALVSAMQSVPAPPLPPAPPPDDDDAEEDDDDVEVAGPTSQSYTQPAMLMAMSVMTNREGVEQCMRGKMENLGKVW